MEKKIKLYEPIRRGASSLPPDLTEELKKMTIEFPYPKKISENKYEIAPGLYCNKNGLKDYYEEFKRTLGLKSAPVHDTKKYCFDYIKEDVMKWAPDVRKNVTKQTLYMLPLRVTFPYFMPDRYIPAMDYYGEVIDNYDEWKRQREEYIEDLYKQLKNEEE